MSDRFALRRIEIRKEFHSNEYRGEGASASMRKRRHNT